MDTILLIVIIIYSIVLHEIAHGYSAYIFGDKTAKYAGRLTLNPIPHIDPVGSILIPVAFSLGGLSPLGWAKGVPVNLHNIKYRWQEFIISGAGIFTNFIIALLLIVVIKTEWLMPINKTLFNAAYINLGLAFFNLIPIPPFDGMSMLRSIFPSLKHRFMHLEHSPIFLIASILIASTLFSYISTPILNTLLRVL